MRVAQSCLTVYDPCMSLQFLEFSRSGHWSGLPFPSPGGLPNPEIESRPPASQMQDSLPAEPQATILLIFLANRFSCFWLLVPCSSHSLFLLFLDHLCELLSHNLESRLLVLGLLEPLIWGVTVFVCGKWYYRKTGRAKTDALEFSLGLYKAVL